MCHEHKITAAEPRPLALPQGSWAAHRALYRVRCGWSFNSTSESSALNNESTEDDLFTQDHIGTGAECLKREKPCLTGLAMASRLAATGAVAETSEDS